MLVGPDDGHVRERRLQRLVEGGADLRRPGGQPCPLDRVGCDADRVRGGGGRHCDRERHQAGQQGSEFHVRRRTNAITTPAEPTTSAATASHNAVSSLRDADGVAAFSDSVGAGCSGSPPFGSGAWSHLTTVPSAYVCVAAKLTVSVLGSCSDTRNNAN